MSKTPKDLVVRMGPIILAIYLVLAIKWYPGWFDSRLCFQEPVRVLFYGFHHEWPIPGCIRRVSRPAWPLLLLPVLGCSIWWLIRSTGRQVGCYLGDVLRRGLLPARESTQLGFRVLVLVAFINHVYVPWNMAVGRGLVIEPIHDVVTYALLPLNLVLYSIYFCSTYCLRAVLYFFNPFCIPASRPPTTFQGSGLLSSYTYDGVGLEVCRFLLTGFLLAVLMGLVSPLVRHHRRTARVVLGLFLLSLGIFIVIGVVNPACLR